MKNALILALLVFVGVAGWRVGESLSSDATGMAVGILLGVMAGIPTALLVLASGRRRRYDDDGRGQKSGPHYSQISQQPPVIVVTGHGGPAQGAQHQPAITGYGAHDHFGDDYYGSAPGAAGGGRPPRQFNIVGDSDEWEE